MKRFIATRDTQLPLMEEKEKMRFWLLALSTASEMWPGMQSECIALLLRVQQSHTAAAPGPKVVRKERPEHFLCSFLGMPVGEMSVFFQELLREFH